MRTGSNSWNDVALTSVARRHRPTRMSDGQTNGPEQSQTVRYAHVEGLEKKFPLRTPTARHRTRRSGCGAHANTGRCLLWDRLGSAMFPHPWPRLNIAIRTMLSTRWGDHWPTVKAELGNALKFRSSATRRPVVELMVSSIDRRRFLQVGMSVFAAPLAGGRGGHGGGLSSNGGRLCTCG